MEPKLMRSISGLEGKRAGLLQLAFVAAASLCLSAFEYTSAEMKLEPVAGELIKKDYLEEEKELDVEIIKEVEKPQPENNNQQAASSAQPVSASTQITVVSGPVDPVAFIPTDPIGPIVLVDPVGTGTTVVNEEFTIVEDMPYFKECAKIKDKAEREKCTQQMMYAEFGKIIKYPSIARENNIQGTVYVTFRINAEGNIDDVSVKRGVQADLDKEAVRVVSKLPQMVPGKQRGEKVNVRYTIPIKFSLF